MKRFVLLCIALLTQIILCADAIPGSFGFRLYMSSESGVYTYGSAYAIAKTAQKSDTEITYVVPSAGTWYWVLTAYANSSESGPSDELSYTTTSPNTEITFGWGRQKWALTHATTLKVNGVTK
jgi:hypothetical protein